MRYVFIANPNAGAKNGPEKYRERIVAAFEKIGAPYKFLLTGKASDLTDFARSEGAVGDDVRIIVLAGDGGICGAANGVIGMDNVEFGIIPCGSGNDYVKTFGGAKGFEDIERYLTAPSRYVDAIDTGHFASLNICSMGIDAIICDKTNRMTTAKKLLGSGAYTLAVLLSMLGKVYNTLKVTIDDSEVYEGEFMFSLAACGEYYGGGYRGAPMADPCDGLLDFVMIKRVSKLKMASLLGEYKSGQYPSSKKFEGLLTVKRGRKMKIESSKPAIVNIDGECLKLSEVTFEVIPKALRLIVNDENGDQ
jgi:Sphingosine kinase and enzymes related to eukaryotic diacylglycerol kinase